MVLGGGRDGGRGWLLGGGLGRVSVKGVGFGYRGVGAGQRGVRGGSLG